ncbi:CoA transferase [Ruegeria atlantica]|uniref:CoA transferase n=1 Tax=Ruegeria atlantica TaxID=81569 RepID=UPI0009E7D2C4|nr:CoA transferase [Ruegeria atlantica]
MIIACGNDRQYARLCEILGQSELIDDTRFSSNADRVEDHAALTELLTNSCLEWTKADLLATLEQPGVPDPRTPIRFSRSELQLDKASAIRPVKS